MAVTRKMEETKWKKNSKIIFSKISHWIWVQAMDKEDTVNALIELLDGIGIEKEEIEQFINWE